MQICKPIYEHVGIFKNATDDKSLTDHLLFQQLVGALFNSALTIKPDAVQRKLYQEIFMHLNDATLQKIIPQNNMKEFDLWKYLQKSFGQIRTSQIIALW